MVLGDRSPRTALSLALSLTAQAKYHEAAALLRDWEGEIATADLGLALALAGQPERGIHLMSNAIRSGDNTVKMRQNLAYAYAVAGRWREARVMAAQDVPAGEVGNRMEQWAAMASPDAYQHRVARLLGVPANVVDTGQPVHLALSNTPGVDQLAAEATGMAMASAELPVASAAQLSPVAQNAAGTSMMAVPASAAELPAVGSAPLATDTFQTREPARASGFAQAFAAETIAPVRQDAQSFAAPAPAAAQPAAPSARYAAAAPAAPRVAGQPGRAPAAAPVARTAADGTHLVQLGSFSSDQAARRAWGIYVNRYPELSAHEMVITEAVVNGRRFFRVSAGGFDRTASRAMCGRVSNSRGDGCISWAAATPLPGAVDTGLRLARR